MLVAAGTDLAACAPARLPREGGFDYQLGASHDADLGVVVRDASAAPLPGAYSVCYVNGFQTQPGQEGLWDEHPELLLRDAAGEPVVDPDWPDEILLDPSTPARRDGILAVLGPVIAGCAEAGFDAFEIDNLDSLTRTDALERTDALALAADFARLAHEHGLEIAQKNVAEFSRTLHDELGYDLAVVEECGAYAECAAFTEVYGEDVLQIEYPDSLAAAGLTFADVCAMPDRAPHTILRDRGLVGPEDPEHLFAAC